MTRSCLLSWRLRATRRPRDKDNRLHVLKCLIGDIKGRYLAQLPVVTITIARFDTLFEMARDVEVSKAALAVGFFVRRIVFLRAKLSTSYQWECVSR